MLAAKTPITSKSKPKVYVETSVISYLAARASKDVVNAARQQLTRQWWQQAGQFQLCTSALVYDEARQGAPGQVARRLALLDSLLVLTPHPALAEVAGALIRATALPEKAVRDAEHIAMASLHQAAYLVTWNFRHIANPVTAGKIDAVLRLLGYTPAVLCSPEQLIASA